MSAAFVRETPENAEHGTLCISCDATIHDARSPNAVDPPDRPPDPETRPPPNGTKGGGSGR